MARKKAANVGREAASYLKATGIDDDIVEMKVHDDKYSDDQAGHVNLITDDNAKYTVSYRLVGNRLELWRQGSILEYIGEEPPAEPEIPTVDLEALTVKQLRTLAETAEIAGYSKMRRTELIEALS